MRGRRILVVEDHPDLCLVLRHLLKHSGNECLICGNAADAFAVIGSFDPHAVILDVGLPHTSGIELAKAIRARPDGEKFVLIGCSGTAYPTDRQQGLDAGMDAYFSKPADIQEILDAIDHFAAERLPD